MPLTKAQAASFFDAFKDDPRERVNFPPAGGEVWVRPLGLTGRGRIWQARNSGDGAMEAVLSYCVVSEEGEPFASAGKWAAIVAKHGDESQKLFDVAWRLSFADEALIEKN